MATFFRSLGSKQVEWEVLAADLQALLLEDARRMEATEFGEKYEIRGCISGPNGQTERVITAWIILKGEDAPRFVTAYPEN